MTLLADLRADLATTAAGKAVINGLPYVDGAEVSCYFCRRPIEETNEVEVRSVQRVWHLAVSHTRCGDEQDRLAAKVEELRGRLRELEWAGGILCDQSCCPACSVAWSEDQEHDEDCWLAKEIAATSEQQS